MRGGAPETREVPGPPAGGGGGASLEKKPFRPYVPADQNPPEFTPVSVITGVLLAVVFGGANA